MGYSTGQTRTVNALRISYKRKLVSYRSYGVAGVIKFGENAKFVKEALTYYFSLSPYALFRNQQHLANV